MRSLFGGAYDGIPVLLTGHTGFKGSWLALWLEELGADVVGYALAPPTEPNHHDLLGLDIVSVEADVRDHECLVRTLGRHAPRVVFHLAAQSLVRRSFREPRETFDTNVMGTVNLLEACRASRSVRAVVVVTSDKVYENFEQAMAYRESDRLGGRDPYSASKACSELVASSYRRSFFGGGEGILLATARAGNVLGGGDWGEDRLLPDIVRATTEDREVRIRAPRSVRPWQHVLDPLRGYLMLGEALLAGRDDAASAWNFGPPETEARPVARVVEDVQRLWEKVRYTAAPSDSDPPEARLLTLHSGRAQALLGWTPLWSYDEALRRTVQWYRHLLEDGKVSSREQLADYIETLMSQRAGHVG